MQLYYNNKRNITPHRSRRRYSPLKRHHNPILERMHQEGTQRLVERLHDIIFALGLTQGDYSLGGGRVVYSPQVISVAECPVRFDIRMLPGQIPDDFAVHTKRIAYNLGVAKVQVVPLGPSLIRLILVPGSRSGGCGDSTT